MRHVPLHKFLPGQASQKQCIISTLIKMKELKQKDILIKSCIREPQKSFLNHLKIQA